MSSAKEAPKSGASDIPERINDFIQKNRRVLLVSFIALILIFIGSLIGITIRERIQTRAISQVDELQQRYNALMFQNQDVFLRQAEMSVLLQDLGEFERRNSGFAAARANSIMADIHWNNGNWAEAESAWLRAASIASRNYLGPISLFNAAAAAEEQGNIAGAIDLYTRAVAYGQGFPAASRAQFAIGRLEESRNNTAAAVTAYRVILSRWPHDPLWADLAQSRLIILAD